MPNDSIQTAYRSLERETSRDAAGAHRDPAPRDPSTPVGEPSWTSPAARVQTDASRFTTLDAPVFEARATANEADAPRVAPEGFDRAESRLAWARVRELERELFTQRSEGYATNARLRELEESLQSERVSHEDTRTALRRERERTEDLGVVRRGLTDDLRVWRRRATSAENELTELRLREAHAHDAEAGDDAAWREAMGLARRLAVAEQRAADLREECEALMQERDRLESALASLAESVESVAGDEAWDLASSALARAVSERDEWTSELAASAQVRAALRRERDAAYRAAALAEGGRTAALRRARARRLAKRHRGVGTSPRASVR
ncbi:MAG: hypothetical protein H6721_10125 [Sandaracinus sp.]|nr:hypothetical protein [Sandaracinus sp.]MCB9632473.1 hypothetical protein [Sandaracinus sp.]